MAVCSYFQAHVTPSETWFVVATLRSHEHWSFDRTLDSTTGLFEFFVPQGYEERFVTLMGWYERQGLIKNFVKMPNRLEDPSARL